MLRDGYTREREEFSGRSLKLETQVPRRGKRETVVTALQCGQNVTEQGRGGREDVSVGEGYTVCV